MEEVFLTEEELQERLKEWQKRLRLQDWIIQVKIKRARDMRENSEACINWVLEKKMAIISILDPIDYDPTLMVPQDMENSLVHELLHLHFAPLDEYAEDEKFTILEEQAIECIAAGIITAHREIKKPKIYCDQFPEVDISSIKHIPEIP